MNAHRAFYATASFEETTRNADGAISQRSWDQLVPTLEGAVSAPAHEGGVSFRGAQLLDTLSKHGLLSVFFVENHNSIRLGNWYTRSVLTLRPDQDHEFLIAAARRSERGEGSDPPLRVLQAPLPPLRGQLTSVVWVLRRPCQKLTRYCHRPGALLLVSSAEDLRVLHLPGSSVITERFYQDASGFAVWAFTDGSEAVNEYGIRLTKTSLRIGWRSVSESNDEFSIINVLPFSTPPTAVQIECVEPETQTLEFCVSSNPQLGATHSLQGEAPFSRLEFAFGAPASTHGITEGAPALRRQPSPCVVQLPSCS